MRLLITGGAGFIGSNLIRFLLQKSEDKVLNIDRLCFPGLYASIAPFNEHPNYTFKKLDICNEELIRQAIFSWKPDSILHLAAESHVDRSIDSPRPFMQSNVVGTYVLLEAAREYWRSLPSDRAARFRFHHVSTDEVYGALSTEAPAFTETHAYSPNSPYAASKAASDHFVNAWHRTYGLPVLITNCSNNYGPYQFPEKLVPLMISKALRGENLPLYGTGSNVRDWLYVDDHVRAILAVLKSAVPGRCYNIGGDCEHSNLEVVKALCALLDEMRPRSPYCPHEQLIEFVDDRPGHDFRYAMDNTKIRKELSWRPLVDFEMGLRKSVIWYLNNQPWVNAVTEGVYRGQRLGLLQQ